MKRLIRALAAVLLAVTMLVSAASALTVEQALGLLEQYYVGVIPEEAYEVDAVEELTALLGDPYTYYMTEEEYAGFLDMVEGTISLVGIGVSIQYTDEGIYIVEALKGGPALAAGIQDGDIIVAVDGVSCVPAGESHRAMIMGEEGTDVTVTIRRDGRLMNFVVQRAPVVIPNTEAALLEDGVGYIACSSFGSDTANLILAGVETYGEDANCWLVDMRGNSGGYTDVASDVTGIFAGQGFHIFLRDGQGQVYYYLYNEERSVNTPVIVLVDGNSASAAEAFSATMRDLNASILVGSRTYGKGVAQVVFDKTTHPDLFEEDGFKLTMYRFFSGGGTTVDKIGVIPTLLVPDELAYDVALAVGNTSVTKMENALLIKLGEHILTIDCGETEKAVLSALFEALPPGVELWVNENGSAASISVEEAAKRFDVSFDSRWFDDVAESSFANEINTLATYGLIHGDGEGNFRPQDHLTRGEVCAMLAKALRLEGSDRQQFDDVSADDPCAPYVNTMAELGFVIGMDDGTFCPDRPVTQQEYYVMLARLARYLNYRIDFWAEMISEQEQEEMQARGFRPWACGSAVLMEELDALHANGEQTPNDSILRQEAAASLCAVLVGLNILPA